MIIKKQALTVAMLISMTGGAPDAPAAPWKLAANQYTSTSVTGLLPKIVSPRPSTETATGAYANTAHPGVEWETAVSVFGGSWPYKYSLMNSSFTAEGVEGVDYPTGMSLGQTLTIGVLNRFPGPKYGVITWLNPTGTSETIYLQVEDQDGNIDQATVVIGVDATRFVVVANTGDDVGGAGTLASPLQTLHTGVYGNGHSDKNVIFRGGNYDVYAGVPPSQLQLTDATEPRGFIGYPGETVTLNTVEGNFSTSTGLQDLFVSNIIFDGTRMDARNFKLWRLNSGNDDRAMFFKCTFNNMAHGHFGDDNPGCIVPISGGTRRSYLSVIRCNLGSNSSVQLFGGYDTDYVVCEHNTYLNGRLGIDNVNNRWFGFSSGGTYEIVPTDIITGATSGSTSEVVEVILTSGSWAGGDATGWMVLTEASRDTPFVAENLNVGANLNVATVYDDTSGGSGNADMFIQPKIGCQNTSIRANIVRNIDYQGGHSVISFNNASGVFNLNQEVCWNVIEGTIRRNIDACIGWNVGGSGGTKDNQHTYRNNLVMSNGIGIRAADAPASPVQVQDNVGFCQDGLLSGTVAQLVDNGNNVSLAADDFDANGDLINGGTNDPARTNNVGLTGYEVGL